MHHLSLVFTRVLFRGNSKHPLVDNTSSSHSSIKRQEQLGEEGGQHLHLACRWCLQSPSWVIELRWGAQWIVSGASRGLPARPPVLHPPRLRRHPALVGLPSWCLPPSSTNGHQVIRMIHHYHMQQSLRRHRLLVRVPLRRPLNTNNGRLLNILY